MHRGPLVFVQKQTMAKCGCSEVHRKSAAVNSVLQNSQPVLVVDCGWLTCFQLYPRHFWGLATLPRPSSRAILSQIFRASHLSLSGVFLPRHLPHVKTLSFSKSKLQKKKNAGKVHHKQRTPQVLNRWLCSSAGREPCGIPVSRHSPVPLCSCKP